MGLGMGHLQQLVRRVAPKVERTFIDSVGLHVKEHVYGWQDGWLSGLQVEYNLQKKNLQRLTTERLQLEQVGPGLPQSLKRLSNRQAAHHMV